MPKLTEFLSRGATITALLRDAGFRDEAIKENRAFWSRWAWDDGRTAVVTVWLHEVLDPDGVPKWSESDPALRSDLGGTRLHHAQEVYSTLLAHADEPVRVMLQKLKPDPKKRKSGAAESRGLDPELWYVSVAPGAVYLQRGEPEGRRDVAITGEPMPSRPPGNAFRETRPEQMKFRARVALKSGNRCALTGAPSELCDAAHFPWVDWRTANSTRDGVMLRRDLHAALDAGLLSIDQVGLVSISGYLASASEEYSRLHGRIVPI